jgi:aminoglycoside N3'-acetyltransferase
LFKIIYSKRWFDLTERANTDPSKLTDETTRAVNHLISSLGIPDNRILYLHVRSKGVQSIVGGQHAYIAKSIIDSIQRIYRPKTILVPSYTYTFAQLGLFHRLFSKSEVGRFSEEVRSLFPERRTPDPIFSVIDTTGFLENARDEIDYRRAFGPNSLFDYLTRENAIIINIGLEELISAHLHHVEKINDVKYRYDKIFPGFAYYDESTWEKLQYNYFVRDLQIDTNWNRKKIEDKLIQTGVLHSTTDNGVRMSWMSTQECEQAISTLLSQDEMFLIT